MIYLIFTTCIRDKLNPIIPEIGVTQEYRDNTYKNAIRKTLSFLPYFIKPIIVENNGKRATFMDDFQIPVIYTESNKHNYQHKGVNELQDIKTVIEQFKIKDDDIIIKVTGRYYPLNDSFFRIVLDKLGTYEAVIKAYSVSDQKFTDDDVVLGLFAIKCKHLKRFEYKDFTKSPEVEFARFLKTIQGTILKVETLHLRCLFANSLLQLDV